jgi:AraC-like DNA-binding protein
MPGFNTAMTRAGGIGPLPRLVEEMAGARALARSFAAAGLPMSVVENRRMPIPLRNLFDLYDAAARAVGDADFGLRVGQATSPLDYGHYGAFAMGARTLGGALRRVVRTLSFHQSGTRMTLDAVGDHVVWRYATGAPSFRRSRHHSDHTALPMVALVQGFLGSLWRPSWLECDYPRPPHKQGETFGDVPRVHDCDATGVAIEKSALSRRRPETSRPMPVVTFEDLRRLGGAPSALVDRVLALIELRLLEDAPEIDAIAIQLGVGARTLQRGLQRESTSFRALLALARHRRAASLLRETDLSVTDIAFSLGYNEPANFTRAFTSWAGRPPTAFRAP